MTKNTIRSLARGEAPPSLEPRRYKQKRGYIVLRWKTGPGMYVETYEHRLKVGLTGGDGTHVHHRNGTKSDNNPDNLEILTPSQHGNEHRVYPVAVARRLRAGGMSLVQVAAAMGTDSSVISRILRTSGGDPIDPLNKGSQLRVDTALVLTLFGLGASPTIISGLLGLRTASAIRRIIARAGLPSMRAGRPTGTPEVREARLTKFKQVVEAWKLRGYKPLPRNAGIDEEE